MVDTGIFATTAEVGYKAGANKSTVSSAEAYVNSYVAQAESIINVATKKNWSDAYSTLNADVKAILKDAASNLAAMYVINYDISGFTSSEEAALMLNVLRDSFVRDLEILKDVVNRDFAVGA